MFVASNNSRLVKSNRNGILLKFSCRLLTIIVCVCVRIITGFPLGLENLEKWEGIFQSGKSQGILNRLEKSGKITQNTGKLREFEINII